MTRAAAPGARVLTSVIRWAGRDRPSLTSATITGVRAVAAIVPAPQKCETNVAATTAATEAMTSVGRSRPPPSDGGAWGGGAPWRRVREWGVVIGRRREAKRTAAARGRHLTTRST